MTTEPTPRDARIDLIAGKITAGIYSAPLHQATHRQREIALSIASNIDAALRHEPIWIGYDPADICREETVSGTFVSQYMGQPDPHETIGSFQRRQQRIRARMKDQEA